jgi:hypothetical protein
MRNNLAYGHGGNMDGCAAATLRRTYSYRTRHTAEMIRDLAERAYECRMQVLRMVYGSKTGHIATETIQNSLLPSKCRLNSTHIFFCKNHGDTPGLVLSHYLLNRFDQGQSI